MPGVYGGQAEVFGIEGVVVAEVARDVCLRARGCGFADERSARASEYGDAPDLACPGVGYEPRFKSQRVRYVPSQPPWRE